MIRRPTRSTLTDTLLPHTTLFRSDQKMCLIRVPVSGHENQTLNGYSNDYPKTPYGCDSLMNHEFSHEGFANQLSVRNYDDLWLHEGLGSYAQPLLAPYYGGELD